MKKYIIIAGVNGAGKSTLYETLDELKDMPRINTDEIVKVLGDWRDTVSYTHLDVYKRQATIYLNSILPAVGVGLEADPDYPRIGEYNEAMKTMAEEKGYHFIDNTQMAQEHQDLYQEDGLHVQPDFYKYWAANMMAGVNES